MLFNSWGYLLFLLLAIPLHWWVPHRARVYLLGAVSVLFYGLWRWEFVVLIVITAAIDFFGSLKIYEAADRRAARRWLVACLVANLALLSVFKYTYFVYDNIRLVGSLSGFDFPALQDLGIRILLPLGISFYTFESMSYTIDVYRGVFRPTRSFAYYFAFIVFWPKLIAGPILRPREVIPQLEAERRWSSAHLAPGLLLILSGLFKKVVLADNLAPIVDFAFGFDATQLTAIDVWAAACFFGLQIYFDFGGYADIAVGSARLCGIYCPRNFDFPYLALSPRDFWRRWHITLSSWIRDYLYLPLTGARFEREAPAGLGEAVERGGRTRALFLTWAIMGLWHGADWRFVVWGLYHAAAIYLYRVLRPLRFLEAKAPPVAWAMMFAVAMAGWIPFRAQSLSQAFSMFAAILDPRRYHFQGRVLTTDHYLALGALVAAMLLTAWAAKVASRIDWDAGWAPRAAVAAGVAALTTCVIALLRALDQFIYFQF